MAQFEMPIDNCKGRLKMIDTSKCQCECGSVFDPTLEFQLSSCCGDRLKRKTFHYSCSSCGKTVPSWFVFNERIFDKTYFKEMMQKCRERKRKKHEEIRQLLSSSRSDHLELTDNPDLDRIPGLMSDLNDFIDKYSEKHQNSSIFGDQIFNIDVYRSHILSGLGWNPIEFSRIAPLIEDQRKDRVCRFITLIFMQNNYEVDIEQIGQDLLIQRIYDEAHA